MKESGWLSEENEKIQASELAATALEDDSIIRRAQLVNITEFGRTVHAEMAALMDAALRGVSVKEMTLYTTTFPCHMCAKHIVAAGIRRVVYIEPYPKSLSQPLYIDSIEVEAGSVTDRIPFDPFIGIAPRRYVEMFSAPEDRKTSDGGTIPWVPGKDKKPKVGIFDLAVAARESVALEAITDKLESLMGEGDSDGNESK